MYGHLMHEGHTGDLPFVMTICPDRQIVGKKVTTLFPHFSMEGWQHALTTVDMRTGRSREPMTQIRLQGSLWDVFAGKKGAVTSYQQPGGHWDPIHNIWVQDPDGTMEFLERTNKKSKICEYKFTAQEGHHGPVPGHPWGH